MESIKEKREKSKYLPQLLIKGWIFGILSTILAAGALFGTVILVQLFILRSEAPVNILEGAFATNLSGKEGGFVASRSGETYYFPWCGSANRIKDENLVWFKDRAEAEQNGYRPASNCHGLK
jgi:hypothetical protein